MKILLLCALLLGFASASSRSNDENLINRLLEMKLEPKLLTIKREIFANDTCAAEPLSTDFFDIPAAFAKQICGADGKTIKLSKRYFQNLSNVNTLKWNYLGLGQLWKARRTHGYKKILESMNGNFTHGECKKNGTSFGLSEYIETGTGFEKYTWHGICDGSINGIDLEWYYEGDVVRHIETRTLFDVIYVNAENDVIKGMIINQQTGRRTIHVSNQNLKNFELVERKEVKALMYTRRIGDSTLAHFKDSFDNASLVVQSVKKGFNASYKPFGLTAIPLAEEVRVKEANYLIVATSDAEMTDLFKTKQKLEDRRAREIKKLKNVDNTETMETINKKYPEPTGWLTNNLTYDNYEKIIDKTSFTQFIETLDESMAPKQYTYKDLLNDENRNQYPLMIKPKRDIVRSKEFNTTLYYKRAQNKAEVDEFLFNSMIATKTIDAKSKDKAMHSSKNHELQTEIEEAKKSFDVENSPEEKIKQIEKYADDENNGFNFSEFIQTNFEDSFHFVYSGEKFIRIRVTRKTASHDHGIQHLLGANTEGYSDTDTLEIPQETFYAQEIENPEILSKLKPILDEVNYKGIGCFDVKYRNGDLDKPILLEVNPRICGSMADFPDFGTWLRDWALTAEPIVYKNKVKPLNAF